MTYSNFKSGKRCRLCSHNAPISYDYVKRQFEAVNYKLLSKEYINSSTKLKYICPKGTISYITWNSFQQGHRCGCCAKNVQPTMDKIKKSFEDRNAKLLSKKYLNCYEKLDYICENGHKQQISWDSWSVGHGCPICAGNKKHVIEFVKKEFEKEKYILLSKEYINNKNKLKYECPKGHIHFISYGKWLYGRRCPTCAIEKSKVDFNLIKESFAKENYILLSEKYISSLSKLKYKCPKGTIGHINWNSWSLGHRCKCCAYNMPTIDFIRKEFEKENYILLSNEYVNGTTKLNYICPKGHRHSMSWSNWNHPKKYRCTFCARERSSIRMFGSGNPQWKGGITCEPYCEIWLDKEYKKDIKIRDQNICLNPYCNNFNTNDLVIHHVDYNKKNCSPSNLITVCRSCNIKANIDRSWHQLWYKTILNKRYKYNCL